MMFELERGHVTFMRPRIFTSYIHLKMLSFGCATLAPAVGVSMEEE